MNPPASPLLERRQVIGVFLAFAFAYFLSTLMRAITATLSPALTQELALSAQDLGLLAGGYFLGFSVTQLPLGKWLDLHGPKKVILSFWWWLFWVVFVLPWRKVLWACGWRGFYVAWVSVLA